MTVISFRAAIYTRASGQNHVQHHIMGSTFIFGFLIAARSSLQCRKWLRKSTPKVGSLPTLPPPSTFDTRAQVPHLIVICAVAAYAWARPSRLPCRSKLCDPSAERSHWPASRAANEKRDAMEDGPSARLANSVRSRLPSACTRALMSKKDLTPAPLLLLLLLFLPVVDTLLQQQREESSGSHPSPGAGQPRERHRHRDAEKVTMASDKPSPARRQYFISCSNVGELRLALVS
jgi:hypothetical protein